MTSAGSPSNVGEQLDRAQWHLLRSDSLRAGVASRAGLVLSTNALVIAGIALAFSVRSNKPGIIVTVLAIPALISVAVSAMNASLAIVTVRRWPRQFPMHERQVGPPYSFAELDAATSSFDGFRHRMIDQPTGQLLDDALAELWRCGVLHSYRYAKLRTALRWLLTALCFFLSAVTASALTR
ncbi:hypothetical protein AB0M80_43280 [Amycolatopsis sp. NPDC051045]|uniref:hypothetical protein n=1 Tax=Amycolatopsis sp. NPDC051045 TaxID=3156922 RepID=UPI00341A21D2